MTRRWCCLCLIALTVTVAARPAGQERRASERPALVGLDTAAVEQLLGPPSQKEELADSNEAYWTYKTDAGALTLHFQNSVVLNADPADFPIERLVQSPADPSASASSPWTAYVRRFLAEPEHPGDLSDTSFAEDLVRTRARLAELRAIDPSRLSKDEAIDLRFVETLLVRREIDQAQMRRWRLDPRVYMQSIQTLTQRLAAGEHKPSAADVLGLLKAIPTDLRSGRRNLRLSIPHFQELALTIASDGRTTLTTAVAAFAETAPDRKDAILEAAATARAALTDWTDFLSKELPKKPSGYMTAGIDAFAAIVRDEFLIQYSLDELFEFTRREFERTETELKNAAAAIDDSRAWLAVAAGTAEKDADEPDADAMKETFRAAGETARTNLDASFFVAVPWRDSLAEWQFTQGDSTGGAVFGAFDPAVVSIQAYGAYSDRVRALYQSHNTSEVRRVRSASTFTGGWPLYVEQVVEEKKLVTDRTLVRLLQWRLLAIVRAAVDIGYHTHRMTETQALSFFTDRVGLTKAAAEQELAAVIDEPGSGLGYLGLTEIARLRDDVQKKQGDAFSLADFHERLLKTGPLPLTLVRAALLP